MVDCEELQQDKHKILVTGGKQGIRKEFWHCKAVLRCKNKAIYSGVKIVPEISVTSVTLLSLV
jgi:hypothetical protein